MKALSSLQPMALAQVVTGNLARIIVVPGVIVIYIYIT